MSGGDDRHILQSLANAKQAACLAFVAETWGSAPRSVGSMLAVFADGSFVGSVSGGCIEADIITEACQMMESGESQFRRRKFGISDADAWEAGLACGGKMQIIIVPILSAMDKNIIKDLEKFIGSRQEAILVIQPDSHEVALWVDGKIHAGDCQLSTLPEVAKSKLIEFNGGDVLLCCYPPPPRLVILGAVHIATHLAPMAAACGIEVHIIDPRAAWLRRDTIENLPAELHESWSDTALQSLRPDSQTAFVALTHDPKLDDPAFAYLFKHAPDCFYMGALGSQKTHSKRMARLKENDADDKDIAKIHSPIGLNIGAANPAEIAVAILAEIILALRGAKS